MIANFASTGCSLTSLLLSLCAICSLMSVHTTIAKLIHFYRQNYNASQQARPNQCPHWNFPSAPAWCDSCSACVISSGSLCSYGSVCLCIETFRMKMQRMLAPGGSDAAGNCVPIAHSSMEITTGAIIDGKM
jgi:hypothetical protein